jgi:serine/threonine-protein kinase
MSVVFLAEDERLRREVAFKLLRPELAGFLDVVTRFMNEAQMLARIDSAHVVRLLDAGVASDLGVASLPYMVLESLHGGDLRERCALGPVEPERVVGWTLEACEGLAAAHVQGVIHRDLKPENLFLSLLPDGTESVKLLDFGIARSFSAESLLTRHGSVIGSPGYMSPEQLREASDADERSDIWSLGVVMFELITGVPPFQAPSAFEVCARVLAGRHPSLDELCPAVPARLAVVVHRCLTPDPEDRFGSVLELAEALAETSPGVGREAARRIQRRMASHRSAPQLSRLVSSVDARAETEPFTNALTKGLS